MANYLQLHAVKSNPDFVARVSIGIAKYALYIMDEAPNTPNHKPRFAWALNAVANPNSVAAGLLPAIVLDAAVQAKAAAPDTITDAELQGAVEAAVNRALNA